MIFRGTWYLLLPTLLLFASCSATQTVSLALDDSAHVSLSMEIGGFFEQYLRDLGSAGDSAPLFDPAAIRQGFAKEGIAVTALSSSANRVWLELDLSSPQQIASQSFASPSLIRWNPRAVPAEFTLRFNSQSIRSILASASGLDRESVEYLMPGPNSSRSAYQEDLLWIFGDYGSQEEIRSALTGASIQVEFLVPRDLIAVRGPGLSKTGARTAQLRLPVLDFLTDPEARSYTLRY